MSGKSLALRQGRKGRKAKETEMATEKQVSYSTRYMDSSFKRLGATMRERSGGVRDWLASLERHRISQLIDELKEA